MLLHQVVSRSQLTSGPVSSSKACTWPCQAEESGDLQAVWAHTEGQVLAGASRKFPVLISTLLKNDIIVPAVDKQKKSNEGHTNNIHLPPQLQF